MLKNVKGFTCGVSGAAGLNPNKRHHSNVIGKPGQGRAATCREYTITVRRKSDGATKQKTIGPGYLSRKEWRRRAQKVQAELIAELS